MWIYKALLLLEILLGVIAQLFLKLGMDKIKLESIMKEGVVSLFNKLFLNLPVILGFFSYGLSLFLWVIVLSELDLSYAYPLASLSYVIVAFCSKVFFKEHVSKRRWISITVITLGVVLVGLS